MTIVEEFINNNELALNKVALENRNLGEAIAEALAVIDFYTKTNNVQLSDLQKQKAFEVEKPTAVETQEGAENKELLKALEEITEAPTQDGQTVYYAVISTYNQHTEPYIKVPPQTITARSKEEMLQELNALYKTTFPESDYVPYSISDFDDDGQIDGVYISDDWAYVTTNLSDFLQQEANARIDFERVNAPKWVIAGAGSTDLTRLLVIGQVNEALGNKNDVVNGLRDDIFLVADNKITIPSTSPDFLQDLVAKQKQMTNAELQEARNRKLKIIIPALKANEVVVNAPVTKWVIQSDDDEAIGTLYQAALAFDIYAEVKRGAPPTSNYFLILDEELIIPTIIGYRPKAIEAYATQTQLTQAELDQLFKGAPSIPTTHVQHTPIVHTSKEFVEDDILVSAEDLEALKQLEDLEDLGDINLEDLDI